MTAGGEGRLDPSLSYNFFFLSQSRARMILSHKVAIRPVSPFAFNIHCDPSSVSLWKILIPTEYKQDTASLPRTLDKHSTTNYPFPAWESIGVYCFHLGGPQSSRKAETFERAVAKLIILYLQCLTY
ncbi:Hypothetical protein NTJ_03608 [Nesidiocoris tenuis]|uniref:Uncharacterized protein n=1 Tax=Nesidiocoris tenuis TaxID=355587 RepID=A0ABN7AEU3_9HEMI|nr:Hypothetical protein NTJ_03608 [Nesidiocoris tenuis]